MCTYLAWSKRQKYNYRKTFYRAFGLKRIKNKKIPTFELSSSFRLSLFDNLLWGGPFVTWQQHQIIAIFDVCLGKYFIQTNGNQLHYVCTWKPTVSSLFWLETSLFLKSLSTTEQTPNWASLMLAGINWDALACAGHWAVSGKGFAGRE